MRVIAGVAACLAVAVAALGAAWPPKLTTRRTDDPVVVSRAFNTVRRCMMFPEVAQVVSVSGSFPELQPARKYAAINDVIRQDVLGRVEVECSGPPKRGVPEVTGEISDDCEVLLRTADLLTVSCHVAWGGSAMGAHPDGQIETTTYRIDSARPLKSSDLLRDDKLELLDHRIRESLRADYAEELKDVEPERLDEIVRTLLAAPYLTKQGLAFEYATRWEDFVVVIPYSDAATFLQPAIANAI